MCLCAPLVCVSICVQPTPIAKIEGEKRDGHKNLLSYHIIVAFIADVSICAVCLRTAARLIYLLGIRK